MCRGSEAIEAELAAEEEDDEMGEPKKITQRTKKLYDRAFAALRRRDKVVVHSEDKNGDSSKMIAMSKTQLDVLRGEVTPDASRWKKSRT